MEDQQYCYIRVADEEATEEVMELPSEADGTLSLSTIQAQFPGVSGLRYRNEETMSWRGVRITEGVLYSPPEGWGNTLFFNVYPKLDTSSKRKIDQSPGQSQPEAKLVKTKNQDLDIGEDEHIGDLIVLGLPFRAVEKDMREYFEQFGELSFVQVKTYNDGSSKGFGFVSFKENSAAMTALKRSHTILGRRCEVQLPRTREDPSIPFKLFIGRLANGTTAQDLKSYFEMFGELTDTYVPNPFRGFGFVTFATSFSVKKVMKSSHTIKGAHVNVTFAAPKGENTHNSHNSQALPFHDMEGMMNFFGMQSKGGMNPFAFYQSRGGGRSGGYGGRGGYGSSYGGYGGRSSGGRSSFSSYGRGGGGGGRGSSRGSSRTSISGGDKYGRSGGNSNSESESNDGHDGGIVDNEKVNLSEVYYDQN